ncbi:MAG: 50S ribosomal protein L17 [Planctomycetota bacterium]|nr:50S ribosomal protein L17 [Planctomycetota bacterium]
MRHQVKGKKLGRNGSHRKAMFRNMASSLIRSLIHDDDGIGQAKVPGRIVTTVAKAKELRPRIERLVTIACRAVLIEERAREFESGAEKGSDAWKEWRQSSRWIEWSQTIGPALALRRRAFAVLRDQEAVEILFSELAERFAGRNGGYTRIVKLATPRLGDAGKRALIEFVGQNDRVRRTATLDKLTVRASVEAPPSESIGDSVDE